MIDAEYMQNPTYRVPIETLGTAPGGHLVKDHTWIFA